jgi:hypothetical protein
VASTHGLAEGGLRERETRAGNLRVLGTGRGPIRGREGEIRRVESWRNFISSIVIS